MSKITYVEADGRRHEVELAPGKNLMLAAQAQNVTGILGECGGQLMCATCHVYADEEHLSALPPISEEEDEMLAETVCERLPSSRLSCQLTAASELDGLVLQLPEAQL